MSVSLLALPLLAVSAPQVQTVPPCPPIAAPVAADVAQAPADPSAAAPAAGPAPAPAAAADTTAPATPATAAPPAKPGNEIIVSHRAPSAADPVEAVNVASYKVVTAVDQAVIEPVAHGYMSFVPEPIRDGLHNAVDNLDEPIVFVNFMLQLKPGKALETAARFAINSTLGLGGLFDIAKRKPFNLPRRSNGLADTLGYYGVGPGPYLFLPLIGATTLRDVIARPLDLSVVPFMFGKPFNDPKFALGKGIVSSLDERVQMDPAIRAIRASSDPYAAMRSYYLRRRQAEIDVLKGKRANADVPYLEVKAAPAVTTPGAPACAVAPAAD
ncbi:VacJ family lipoprotein [Novosphingobium colocasiae]|uniref:MlaA family lipoprotein n=1 Tax=Novosphingobium colocasiae TaxID=1256513 RepID=UPI0035AE3DAC